MSAATFFVSQVVVRGNTATLLARIVGANQQAITQSSWYNPTWELWKKDRGVSKRLVAPTSMDPADVLFDTLQTDYGWDLDRDPDGLGYNFRLTVDGAYTDAGPLLVLVIRTDDDNGLQCVLGIEFQTAPVV